MSDILLDFSAIRSIHCYMDAFENLVAEILWRDGYWVRQSVRVNLTRDDKHNIGRPNTPRWEIDVVAYKAATNSLLVVECKSYLDSVGVSAACFDPNNPKLATRFKLFNEVRTWEVVRDRLSADLWGTRSCLQEPSIDLCLALGKVKSETERVNIQRLFAERRWKLFDDIWLRGKLEEMKDEAYENNSAVMAAKILLRPSTPKKARKTQAGSRVPRDENRLTFP